MRAVIACIADKGLDRTSVADIRRSAGVSAGTLYVYFKNKDELISAALLYASLAEETYPQTWRETLELIASTDSQLGFDVTTAARARIQLHAGCVSPGHLHDTYRPMIEGALSMMAEHLRQFEERDEIRLKLPPAQTARAIAALIDGLLILALETDRPPQDTKADLLAGLSCLVELRT